MPPVTLIHALHANLARDPAKRAFTFLADGTTASATLSYAELEAGARAVAAALRGHALHDTPVLLAYPPGLDFVTALLGCLWAGAIAVPVPFLVASRAWNRIAAIAADSGAGAILTLARVAADPARPAVAAGLIWIGTDALPASPAEPPAPDPAAAALIQYTSGSTSSPKGVVISHANLMHNQAMMAARFGHDDSLVGVIWVPAYHDMGLIGGIIQPIYNGASVVLLPPLAVLQQPRRWLAAISTYRGQTSTAPSFAYALCARRIGAEQRAGLDLRCWRVAICGGETVRAAALTAFADAFAPVGFDPAALLPAYGLAEATLMVTCSRPAAAPHSAAFDTGSLGLGHPVAAAPGAPATTLVSCGAPMAEQRLAIVDPVSLRSLPHHRIGEIWVAGGSVAAGYWRQPPLTAATFHARCPDLPGTDWLRTGDLGFWSTDGLFVTGRLKELLIIRGQNLYPQDVEEAARLSHPDLADGLGAAFTIEQDGEEALVLVHELPRTALRTADPAAIGAAIIAAVNRQFGVRLHDLWLLKPGGVPRTTSGKIRRGDAATLYAEGALPLIDQGDRHRLLRKPDVEILSPPPEGGWNG